MTSGRLRGIFFTLIVLTVPFYCIGALLLIGRVVFPPPLRSTPTPNVQALTLTPGQPAVASLRPSVTSILPITPSNLPPISPTPIILLAGTPTQIDLIATPTITLFDTPPPVFTLGPPPSPTPQGQVASCRDYTGNASNVIRADIPGNAAPGATIYCRLLSNNIEIGNAEVLARGVQVAVDVSALASGGASVTRFTASVKICLQGAGAYIFLDATQSPRTPRQMDATFEDGYTCARIPNAGTVVLVNR